MPSSIAVSDENDICLFYLTCFSFLNHCTNMSGLLSGIKAIGMLNAWHSSRYIPSTKQTLPLSLTLDHQGFETHGHPSMQRGPVG